MRDAIKRSLRSAILLGGVLAFASASLGAAEDPSDPRRGPRPTLTASHSNQDGPKNGHSNQDFSIPGILHGDGPPPFITDLQDAPPLPMFASGRVIVPLAPLDAGPTLGAGGVSLPKSVRRSAFEPASSAIHFARGQAPAPIPAPGALVLLGLAGLTLGRRRRR